MTQPQRATSLGATGGLPGANAAPEASELTADELDDTVATGDVVTTPVDPSLGPDVDTVLYAQKADPGSPEAHGLDGPDVLDDEVPDGGGPLRDEEER